MLIPTWLRAGLSHFGSLGWNEVLYTIRAGGLLIAHGTAILFNNVLGYQGEYGTSQALPAHGTLSMLCVDSLLAVSLEYKLRRALFAQMSERNSKHSS